MGMYMFVSEEDRVTKRKVSDEYVNEEFQEALKYDPSLMIEEVTIVKSIGWFGKKEFETYYNVYHETPAFDGSPYQARYQASASGDKTKAVAYLHGIINGIVHLQSKALDNSSQEVNGEQEFKKWFTYFVMHHGDYPSEEATWDWIKTNLLNQIK